MKYIDADQLYKELKRLEELIPVSDGNNMNIDYAGHVISALKGFVERQRREVIPNSEILSDPIKEFKAGSVLMAEQGWHDASETPSIFGVYLVIHEKGWCVANYFGKGTVCETGWCELVHNIPIEHPQKWLDLKDLIPNK